MEIGDEGVDGEESMTRPDYEVGFPRTRGEAFAPNRSLQCPHRGRTDSDDPVALFSGPRVGIGGLLRNVERFGRNPMVVDVLCVDSREGARADVEHDLVDLDAFFSDALEEGLGEM